MNHIIKQGNNEEVIITLHGTGGSADDLFGIARLIDPDATLIGFEGTVIENGMRRYFERYPGGGFNLESLALASQDLLDSIEMVKEKYHLSDKKLTLMGYSNGANLSIDFFKVFENTNISQAILFHPSSITPDKGFKNQINTRVFMTSGVNDPYISVDDFNSILEDMVYNFKNVESFTHEFGHQLMEDEIMHAREFYNKKDNGETK